MTTHRSRRPQADHAPRDHYEEVTARIIAALEAGTPPWRRPWNADQAAGPAMPRNAISGVRYRGINTVMLGMSPLAFATLDPRWATYRQAAERGWQVRKGERGTTAYFFKRIEVPDHKGGEDAMRRIPLLRSFTLFHASQIDDIPAFEPPTVAEAPWRAPDAIDIIMARSGAVVRIGGDRAFYSPATDHIQMPPRSAFAHADAWSSVLMHEAAHWSGGSGRLDRKLTGGFGSHDYAREELRAEISQVMICAEIGLAACQFDNSTAYIADWLKCLREDRREIFRAASDAQRIADYILAFHPDYARREGTQANEPDTADETARHDAPTRLAA